MTTQLSEREFAVLGLTHQGLEAKEVAHRLGIKKATVHTYLERARTKTKSRNTMEMVLRFERGEFNE